MGSKHQKIADVRPGAFNRTPPRNGAAVRPSRGATQSQDTAPTVSTGITLLATLQGGLLLAQVQRDPRPLETAVDTLLQLARSGRPDIPAGNEIPLRDRPR